MYQHILAPIDVAVPEIGEQILEKALFHLRYGQAEITLLAVAPGNAGENAVDEIRGKLMQFAESHIAANEGRLHLKVASGLPSDVVLSTAEALGVDAIVIGSHRGSHSQLGRPTLGSTAAKICAKAGCDVVIVKPEN